MSATKFNMTENTASINDIKDGREKTRITFDNRSKMAGISDGMNAALLFARI